MGSKEAVVEKDSPRTKCIMYKTLIRPVVFYGHEACWKRTCKHLECSNEGCLGRSLGGVQENGVWQRRMNHELARLYGEPSIRKVAKAGRVRWAGHVAKLPHNNPTKMAFASNPVGTRRRGAQRARWLDQVKQDLENVGQDRSWRDTAMDRVNWRNIVNEVLSN